MSKPKKYTALNDREKQYTVLPTEAEPNASFAKAMAAALKAKSRASKIVKAK